MRIIDWEGSCNHGEHFFGYRSSFRWSGFHLYLYLYVYSKSDFSICISESKSLHRTVGQKKQAKENNKFYDCKIIDQRDVCLHISLVIFLCKFLINMFTDFYILFI